MKKLESSLKNMLLVLTGVTVIAVALLAVVNQITAKPIAEANQKALAEGLKVALNVDPQTDLQFEEEKTDNGVIYKTDKGVAVESSSNGFGGELKVLVGFDAEGKIINYSILATSETPGLGSKASFWFKPGNKGDITGKNPGEGELTVSKDGGQIDAITASTITSRAFLKAVNAAYAAYTGNAQTGATSQAKPEEQNVEQVADSTAVAAAETAE